MSSYVIICHHTSYIIIHHRSSSSSSSSSSSWQLWVKENGLSHQQRNVVVQPNWTSEATGAIASGAAATRWIHFSSNRLEGHGPSRAETAAVAVLENLWHQAALATGIPAKKLWWAEKNSAERCHSFRSMSVFWDPILAGLARYMMVASGFHFFMCSSQFGCVFFLRTVFCHVNCQFPVTSDLSIGPRIRAKAASPCLRKPKVLPMWWRPGKWGRDHVRSKIRLEWKCSFSLQCTILRMCEFVHIRWRSLMVFEWGWSLCPVFLSWWQFCILLQKTRLRVGPVPIWWWQCLSARPEILRSRSADLGWNTFAKIDRSQATRMGRVEKNEIEWEYPKLFVISNNIQ